MEIEEYVREERTSRKTSFASSPNGKKRQRNGDPMRNVPAAAAKTFVSVKDLLAKGASERRKQVSEVDLEHADESDSDDAAIEAGPRAPRRTKSTPAATGGSKGKKKQLARSATGGPSKKAPAVKRKMAKELTLDPMDVISEDDSDDEEIELGVLALSRAPNTRKEPPAPSEAPHALEPRKKAPRLRLSSPHTDRDIIDLSSEGEPLGTALTAKNSSRGCPTDESSVDCWSTRGESPEIPLQIQTSNSLPRNESPVGSPKRSSIPPERSQTPPSRSQSESAEPPAGNPNDSLAWLL